MRSDAFIATGADEWEELLTRSFVPLAADRLASSFSGSIELSNLGIARVSDVTADAQRVIRSRRLIADSPHDDLLLSLHLDGEGELRQEGRRVAFTHGCAALYDTAQPYTLSFPARTRQIVVQIPWRELGLDRGRIRAATACAIPMDLPAARMLRVLADEAVKLAEDDAATYGEPLGRTFAGLIAALVLACTGQKAQGTRDIRMGVLASIKNDLRRNLADPSLAVTTVARRHNVSVRYLHALFAEGGDSPAWFLRRERLIRAHQLLGQRRHTVAAVAAQVGFLDTTTFTRAFRAQFGCTPTEYRAGL